MGAALVMDGLRDIKRQLDYQEHGGAPLLGIGGVSVVCHGSSGPRAITQAIALAKRCVENDLVGKFRDAVFTEA